MCVSKYSGLRFINQILQGLLSLFLMCLKILATSCDWCVKQMHEIQKMIGKSDFIEMSYQLLKTIKHRDRGKDSYCQSRQMIIENMKKSLPLYAEDPEVTCRRVSMSSCELTKDKN